MSKKMTLIEFMVKEETASVEWAYEFLTHLPKEAEKGHHGDCTNQPYTCYLCCLESILHDYFEQLNQKQ